MKVSILNNLNSFVFFQFLVSVSCGSQNTHLDLNIITSGQIAIFSVKSFAKEIGKE